MIAFSTTSNLLDKNKNRIEKFREFKGDTNARYSGKFTYDWFQETGLITTMQEDLS
jgi:hypothetical protein